MKPPMSKRLATDVAPPITALLALTVCALAVGLLVLLALWIEEVGGPLIITSALGQCIHMKLDPSFPRDDFSQF